ncbi:MAG: DUF2071 domain-containing protein [Saprospiraceae bacterium]|nr:DUF2071 domain-containing protein [Saprospiraceae bacterium]
MRIHDILASTDHRPWPLPSGPWRYYQEWNRALFLHWQADYELLRPLVPVALQIDCYAGTPWVSLVAFDMQNIRPRGIPAFPPISDFHEINIRTYVRHKDRTGVYFLSIEGGKRVSCLIAKTLSGLPYRYADMQRDVNRLNSKNASFEDRFAADYLTGPTPAYKSALDKWLTERYALFQDHQYALDRYEIHHIEWPVYHLELRSLQVDYPRFRNLLKGSPDLTHYSSGVQVLAWSKLNALK